MDKQNHSYSNSVSNHLYPCPAIALHEDMEELNRINSLRSIYLSDYYSDEVRNAVNNITDLQLRYLIADSENNIDKASNCLTRYIACRLGYEPNFLVNKTSILQIIKSNISVWHKHNKNYSPCLIVRIKYFKNYEHNTDDLVRFLFFMIDEVFTEKLKSSKHNTRTEEKFCVIWDRDEYDEKVNFSKNLAQRLHPERENFAPNFAGALDSIYILNMNIFFRMMFKVAKLFIPKHHLKYIKKVNLVGNPKDLIDYFDKDCLLEEYGGTSVL